MWRRVTRGLVLVGLLSLLLPGLYAQNFVGGIDAPKDTEVVSGYVLVRGWALDQQVISRVDLYIDDQFQFSSWNITLPRIDVIAAYPDFPGIQNRKPGFLVGFSTATLSDGAHTIYALATTSDHRSYVFGTRTIVVNNSINKPPIGVVDIPDDSAFYDANGSFPVAGWAIDSDGIGRIDVMIDGTNMQSAIYGDARPDVGNTFPDQPSTLFSGFVAHVDTTRLLDGVHTLQVRATDRQGFGQVIAKRTVQVFNSENNLRPFGFIDEPLRDATLYGTHCAIVPPCQVSPCIPLNPASHITPVRGWALDLGTRADTGRVSYAELLVDGVRWLSTDNCAYSSEFGTYVNCYGLPRFDVQRYYPTYADSPRSGFVFTLDVGALLANGVPPGHHVLKVRVGDQEQTFAELPNTSGIPVFFQCREDAGDYASLGYIDFPVNMDYVKGNVTFTGWAIDENVGGVNEVQIYVDGNYLGVASYGAYRVDVQGAYPTVRNSLYSGWAFTLDTTQFSDAQHRLTVRVMDMNGNVTEIGSRDFVIDNPR